MRLYFGYCEVPCPKIATMVPKIRGDVPIFSGRVNGIFKLKSESLGRLAMHLSSQRHEFPSLNHNILHYVKKKPKWGSRSNSCAVSFNRVWLWCITSRKHSETGYIWYRRIRLWSALLQNGRKTRWLQTRLGRAEYKAHPVPRNILGAGEPERNHWKRIKARYSPHRNTRLLRAVYFGNIGRLFRSNVCFFYQGSYRALLKSWKSLEICKAIFETWQKSVKIVNSLEFFFPSYSKCLINGFFPLAQIPLHLARNQDIQSQNEKFYNSLISALHRAWLLFRSGTSLKKAWFFCFQGAYLLITYLVR